jgi:hypothetical protein
MIEPAARPGSRVAAHCWTTPSMRADDPVEIRIRLTRIRAW